MAERLSAPMRDRLDALVAVDDDQPHSPLNRIKASSSNPSVGGMKRLLARLELILACIVYWQAREISRLAAAPDFPFDPALLRHVSPIEWKNVVLYGEIKIDPAKLTRRRPSSESP